jgi:hypothetical protein
MSNTLNFNLGGKLTAFINGRDFRVVKALVEGSIIGVEDVLIISDDYKQLDTRLTFEELTIIKAFITSHLKQSDYFIKAINKLINDYVKGGK